MMRNLKKKIGGGGGGMVITGRMCIACWIPKAIDTLHLLLLHSNNGYTNEPISELRTMPVLYKIAQV
jgi:hypothetical protein